MLEKSLWCFEPNRSQKKDYDIFPSPYKFFVGQAEVSFRPTRTIFGRFSTDSHVLFQMQTKNCEFRTKITARQIRKNGNLSLIPFLAQ